MKASPMWTLLLGLLFHLVYIASVFDCYFTSPVVHGMGHFSPGEGEAKRLVLIVGDGLRADLLFNIKPFPSIPGSPEVVAPYLRNIVETRGAFGVSHTRVPTESRPGHVAIIGGMYEDVSAVTKGWKTNPVDFDSVFNQSRCTFSFGSPDILPMFARGAAPGRVGVWSYDEHDEDFTKDATELDYWVVDRLQDLFNNASFDAALDSELRGDRVIYFLHLLGLDTTGHSYRPHSKEYMRNIQVVDEIVERTEHLFQAFFQDDKTSFIFTADHGMSNIGNHGDGNPDSTRTPLIAWGAGVRGPLPDASSSTHNAYSAPWGLSHFYRRDVEQVDIAPLMSTILGINFPANSVGVLPDIDTDRPGYLNLSGGEAAIARAAVANAKSILEHYRVKHKLKASYRIFFVPFPGLAARDVSGLPGSGHILRVEHLLHAGKWAGARKEAGELIRLSLQGLRYIETYDRVLLRTIVVIGYLGWAAFSATALLVEDSASVSLPPKIVNVVNALVLTGLLAFFSFFAIQREPWTYYLYVAFPCYFWRSVALRVLWFHEISKMSSTRTNHSVDAVTNKRVKGTPIKRLLKVVLVTFASLQTMVLAYKHRSIWSVGFCLMGLIWPLLWPKGVPNAHVYKWTAACLLCATFPLRDVEQGEDLRVIVVGGLAMFLSGIFARERQVKYAHSRLEHRIQLALIIAAVLVTTDSVRRITLKEGLPLLNQVLGWIILGTSASLPLLFPFRSQPRHSKLLTLFLAFAPLFVLLSICAEGLFYLTYCVTLVVWAETEAAVRKASTFRQSEPNGSVVASTTLDNRTFKEKIAQESNYEIRVDDVRIAMFFLFFVQVAFFGTGNVASISSFYLEPVYRLIPVFSPFAMAALLVFKIIAPYVMLSAAFASLSQELRMPPFTLFLIALSLTDGMTITFFLNVTDTGSWLEIGQSISFFVITSLLLLWSAGICALGAWLMQGPTFETSGERKRT